MIPYPRRGARFVIAHHPPATADREADRSDKDVHAVADQEAEQRGREEHDRDERDDRQRPLSSRGGATPVTHVVSPLPEAHHEIVWCSRHWVDGASDAARVWS